MTSLRKVLPGSAIDTAYPSTLSRATGQQDVSLRPRGPLDYVKSLKDVDYRALVGLTPRSNKRLAISASVGALLLLFFVSILVFSGSGQKTDPKAALPQPGVENPADAQKPGAPPDAGEPGTQPPPSGAEDDDGAKNGQANGGQKAKPKSTPASPPPKKPQGKVGRKPKLF
jgi:hypothetical protein